MAQALMRLENNHFSTPERLFILKHLETGDADKVRDADDLRPWPHCGPKGICTLLKK